MKRVYLDTETTGLRAGVDEVLELALLDDQGEPLIDTLVRPLRQKSWPEAMAIHGITPEMVNAPGVPSMGDLVPLLIAHLTGARLIIYNAGYDLKFLPAAVRAAPAETSCCMLRFAEHYGEPGRFGGYRWQRLDVATAHIKHTWQGDAHRARADAHAARAVWQYLEREALKEKDQQQLELGVEGT